MRPLAVALLTLIPLAAAAQVPDDIQRWEPAIRQLEELDKSEKDPDDAILFVGSSSVRLWETIAEDMAPYPTIRRGYGGAKFSDLAHFAERIVHPHDFRAVAIFVGNDVSGSPGDKQPAEVVKLLKSVIGTVRDKSASAPVFVIEITPTESRWDVWPKIRAVNTAMAEACSDLDNVHWIGTSPTFLGPDGSPKSKLFRQDRLHLNEDGYDVWAGLIKARLDVVLTGD